MDLNMPNQPRNIDEYTSEERHAILVSAVNHVNAVNPQARITIVSQDDLGAYLAQHKGDKERYRLIVINHVHFTAVDVNPTQSSCVVMDAAVDPRCEDVCKVLRDSQLQVNQPSLHGTISNPEPKKYTRLQNDSHSCSMFSLDHCIQFAHASDTLYDDISKFKSDLPEGEMKNLSVQGYLPWDFFPPNFLWNAQSFSNILDPYENYMDAQNRTAELQQPIPTLSYQEYLEAGVTHEMDPNTKKEIPRNRSIDKHVFTWAERIHFGQQTAYKEHISKAMEAAIKKAEKPGLLQEKTGKTWLETTTRKQEKIDAMRKLKKEFDSGADDHPTYTSGYIKRFETIAQEKRNPYLPLMLKTESTAAAEFSKKIGALRQEDALASESRAKPPIPGHS